MRIQESIPKPGSILKKLNYYLHSSAKAFDSHSKSTLEKAFNDLYGYIPDFG